MSRQNVTPEPVIGTAIDGYLYLKVLGDDQTSLSQARSFLFELFVFCARNSRLVFCARGMKGLQHSRLRSTFEV